MSGQTDGHGCTGIGCSGGIARPRLLCPRCQGGRRGAGRVYGGSGSEAGRDGRIDFRDSGGCGVVDGRVAGKVAGLRVAIRGEIELREDPGQFGGCRRTVLMLIYNRLTAKYTYLHRKRRSGHRFRWYRPAR